MKKILIFSLQYYPLVGGAEVALKELTDRIAPEDIEFHMVTLRFNRADAREEQIGNIHVHRIGVGGAYLSKILFVPLAALYAVRAHRRERFDGAWAMMTYMLFPLVLARLLGLRLPYVLTLQDGDPFERVFTRWFILPFRPLLSYGFRHAAAVTAISTYLAGWAKRAGSVRPVVVPNGADLARFSAAAPADIGREPGDMWLVTSSRLVEKNALDDVIRALAYVPTSVKFLILGAGPDEAALRALAKEAGVTARVVFKGYVSHEELPGYLHACDIFVRPSRTEGMGSSFVEAMAAGLPVIATQEGGIADFLFDAERNPNQEPTGFAVDKDTPAQIAAQIEHIRSHPAEVARVVTNAKKLVAERYDWEQIARHLQEVLLGVCASS